MKKISTLLTLMFVVVQVIAQAPQKMSYQAVIRNSSGELVRSHSIGMKASILRGSVEGTVVYTETLTSTTNANGLVTIELGADGVDWSSGPYFIKLETDPNGGTDYGIVGTSQLLSVPYALYSKTSETALTADYNNLYNLPLLFDGQYSSLAGIPTMFDGNYNSLTNRPTLFDGQYNSLSGLPVLFDGDYNSLANLPLLFNGKFETLLNKPTTIAGYGITDAMTTSHPANEITELNKSNWNAAYSWGNHADAGYLTGLTEAWKKNNGNVYYNTGRVGVGTDTPVNPLSVLGTADFSTSIKTPSLLPLDLNGSISIKTNTVSNSNAGDISILGGHNNSPKNGFGKGGDVTIAGGDFAAEFPTGSTSSRAGNVNIKGGNTPNGGGGVGFPGNINLNGGEGGPNARGGAITLQAGSGNTGGNISITAGAGVGAGQVYIQGGTSTTLNNIGNVTISGGNKTGGGYYGNIIFATSQIQQAIIDATGNFGIGKNAVTKLDVAGVISATDGNSTNWNTAYSWGNHAEEGYAKFPLQTGNDGKVLSTDGTSPMWISPVTSNDLMSKVSKAGDNMTGQLTINNLTGRTALILNSSTHTELRIKGGVSYIPMIIIGTTASGPNAEDAKIQFYDINYGSSSRLAFHIAPEYDVLNLLSNGKVGIGNSNPSEKLDVAGVITSSGGFLPPRLTKAQRDAIIPVEGLIIYNIATKKPNFYDGTSWKTFDGTPID
jgi:hypothetical protein